MRNPIFEPADTSSLGRRSTETPAEFSTLTVEFRSSSLIGEMSGARVAAGASGTSGRIVTDRGAWARVAVPIKAAAENPARARRTNAGMRFEKTKSSLRATCRSLSPLAIRAFTPVLDGLWRGEGRRQIRLPCPASRGGASKRCGLFVIGLAQGAV